MLCVAWGSDRDEKCSCCSPGPQSAGTCWPDTSSWPGDAISTPKPSGEARHHCAIMPQQGGPSLCLERAVTSSPEPHSHKPVVLWVPAEPLQQAADVAQLDGLCGATLTCSGQAAAFLPACSCPPQLSLIRDGSRPSLALLPKILAISPWKNPILAGDLPPTKAVFATEKSPAG